MMTDSLGACEWFVWDLRRSNLVERGQLDQIVGDFMARSPQAEPPDLAAYLVQQGILTPFQSETLLAGKNQGLVLGPYVVTDTLGTGSMGTVYKATSKNNNQTYAVKVLPRRSMWNIRLARRKVRDLEQVKHPSVVPFVDVGTAGSTHYLVWPFVAGQPLTSVVESQGHLSPAETAFFALQVAEGLEACHQVGVIHGLLKPANLLVSGEKQLKILDFGIGALLAETENESVVDTMSTANTMASGLDCASPEGIMDPSQITPISDQYSLGCVMYYCLTGQVPFPGTNAVEKMMAHQTRQPTPIKELAPNTPDGLVAIVERLMSKNPADRYASVTPVITELRPWAQAAYFGMVPPVERPGSRPAVTIPSARPGGSTNGTHTPANGIPRLGVPSRPSSAQINLPTRRSLESDSAAATHPASHPSHPQLEALMARAAEGRLSSTRESPESHSPNPGLQPPPRVSRPVPRPQGQIPLARPATSEGAEKTSIILIVGLGLIACVAGWILANYL